MIKNSIDMDLVEIPEGTFNMGQAGGEADEQPPHAVTLSHAFMMAATPVTNAQYELFDPDHVTYRGKKGLSMDDPEAVLFVSWHEAVRFCEWLSIKEGQPYRLPTEAEWEYACRAGTTSLYHGGEDLPGKYHRHQEDNWAPHSISLAVGQTPPNTFGLHDMHGLVEEWCHDWYGPYCDEAQIDPVGREYGLFRVTRGGSHNTDVAHLRSANRLGTLPDDKHWLIGFRVVQSALPATVAIPAVKLPGLMQGVRQAIRSWVPEHDKPIFIPPIPFVNKPAIGSGTPFYPHNHCPSVTWCPNGDLLAVWFSTIGERGREMTILGSRLRKGQKVWAEPSEFFKAPDRNMTGSSLFHDGNGRLYFNNGLEAGGYWANLAMVSRFSTDNGATWSTPTFANGDHQPRNQVISGMSRTDEGWLIQPCDAVYGGIGGSAIHISRDEGKSWIDPGAGTAKPDFQDDSPGGTIAGIHAGVVQLRDGRLLALGRGDSRLGDDNNIGERMPMSLSEDMGVSWHYQASPFPPISGGQRLVLMRLREGPLLFVSFTDASDNEQPDGVAFGVNEKGPIVGYGLFASLSFDEGESWPLKKLITDGQTRQVEGGAWTGSFVMDALHAEPRGYLAATQTPDGIIHLISSRLHYRFNIKWLEL